MLRMRKAAVLTTCAILIMTMIPACTSIAADRQADPSDDWHYDSPTPSPTPTFWPTAAPFLLPTPGTVLAG